MSDASPVRSALPLREPAPPDRREGARGPAADTGMYHDLRELLEIPLRRRRMVIWGFLATFLPVFAFTFMQTPVYESDSILLVRFYPCRLIYLLTNIWVVVFSVTSVF